MNALLVLEADERGNLSVHSEFPCYIQSGGSSRSPRGETKLKKLPGLPEVRVNVDHLSQSRVDGQYAESPFLHSDDSSLVSTFLQKGWLCACRTALQRLTQPDTKSDNDYGDQGFVNKVVSHCGRAVIAGISWMSQVWMSDAAAIEEHCKVLKWSDALIRALAWHPHAIKLAVAFSDNSVRVYSAPGGSSIAPLLKHKLQKGITDLAWMPYSASTLAVACTNGVFIWQIDPSSLSSRPSPSSVQVLRRPGHQPLTSIAWAPDGSGVLLTASACDSSVVAWDVATERSEILKRKGGKGNCMLLWSPDGSKVLCTTPGPLFRVWDTRTWTCEKWTSLPGKCSAACWIADDASTLLFSTQDAPVIFSLSFLHSTAVTSGPCGGEDAVALMDLRDIDLPAPVSERLVGCQFRIHSMVRDQREGYIAALLTGEDCQGDIVVFRSRSRPAVELSVCGFILSCSRCFAQSINLDKQTPVGTILTIGWSSGHVSYLPIGAFSSPAARETVFMTSQPGATGSSPSLFSL